MKYEFHKKKKMYSVDARPQLAKRKNCCCRAFVWPPTVATTLVRVGPCWRAPLDVYVCVFHTEFQVLFLLVKEGRSTFGVMAGIWAKF